MMEVGKKAMGTKHAMLAEGRALLDKHGLLDKDGIDGWQIVINRDLLKLAGVWTKKAYYRAADLRKGAVLPNGESYYAAAGLCEFKHKVLFIDHRVRARDFEQTVLHEIAHALVGKGGHGNAWKKVAKSIGYKFAPLARKLPEAIRYAISKKTAMVKTKAAKTTVAKKKKAIKATRRAR